MAGVDDNDPKLTLGRMQGDDLTSLSPPALLAPPEAKEGRITVTETGSPTATEGRTLPHGQEMPPLVWHDVLSLSEEEDSLSDAPL